MASIQSSGFSCARDRLTIRGHVFGETDQGRPAVIISHGFLGNEKTVFDYAAFLAAHGYQVVTFDFNGGGPESQSDGRTVDMTVMTEKADLHAVIRAVRAELAPASVSLMGCSQGGFVSAMAAKEDGDIRSLSLFYPALCIPDDARRGQMMFYRFDPRNVPDVLGEVPMALGGEYARSVMALDPFEAIRGYDGPTLLLHGTADDIVDVSYARRARQVYAQCEYHELDGAGHGFSGEYEAAAQAFLLDFLDRHATEERG